MEQQTIKKAALYCRVANENTFAAQSQIEKLRQFAEAKGFEYQVYSDNGSKGQNFERPAFQQMLRDVEAGNVGIIVALKFDRFGRNAFETTSLLREQIERNNIEVISVYEGNLTADICSRVPLCEKLAHKDTRSR